MNAYTEIVDFIAAGTTPSAVAGFTVSDATKNRVEDLLRREKLADLSGDERTELDGYLALEHVMRLAKAKARGLCAG